jgi:hypothetical protein
MKCVCPWFSLFILGNNFSYVTVSSDCQVDHLYRYLSMTANGLHLDDYKRYGRQMILDGIGLPGTHSRTPSPLTFIQPRTAQASSSSSAPPWSSSAPAD